MQKNNKIELLELLEERKRRVDCNKLNFYKPYKKQLEFHNNLSLERLFMAGNQLGKTVAGAFETAMHLTGLYPEWWKGKRFDKPIKAWGAGVTSEGVRDNVQRLLFGEFGEFGKAAIPKDAIISTTSSRGIANLIDFAQIKHISGGISTISLKTYIQGREKWQGETLDWIWFDEEPPIEIYTEGLTRTNVKQGSCIITFTPLLGMSDTVMRFIGDNKSPGTSVINMTINDAEHYTEQQKLDIIAKYPTHEREARINGTPMLGSGRIFTVAEAEIAEHRFEIPSHFSRICGVDFGYDHPFAAVFMAHNRDNDVIHIYDCFKKSGIENGYSGVNLHAPLIRSRGSWIPVAWPHDGLQHDKGSGEQLMQQYKNAGVNMLSQRATFSDGSNGVEAGIQDIVSRLETGRLRVASHLSEWFEEYRLYHRKNGVIVKVRDDLMSATRYALMMLRFAEVNKKSVPLKYGNIGIV
jgi:phage terminase large subunit-like protein